MTKEVDKLNYSEAVDELEMIISEFDSGKITVDELVERFKRAVEILEELGKRIVRAKEQIDAIVPRLEGIMPKTDS